MKKAAQPTAPNKPTQTPKLKIPDGMYRVEYADGKQEIVDVKKVNTMMHKERRAFAVFNWRGDRAFSKVYVG